MVHDNQQSPAESFFFLILLLFFFSSMEKKKSHNCVWSFSALWCVCVWVWTYVRLCFMSLNLCLMILCASSCWRLMWELWNWLEAGPVHPFAHERFTDEQHYPCRQRAAWLQPTFFFFFFPLRFSVYWWKQRSTGDCNMDIVRIYTTHSNHTRGTQLWNSSCKHTLCSFST